MNIYQYTNIKLVKLFKSLSDETRLRIIRVLSRGTFHVNEILFILNHKQSNISHHLKILHEAGLIACRKEGQFVYSEAVPATIAAYSEALAKMAHGKRARSRR